MSDIWSINDLSWIFCIVCVAETRPDIGRVRVRDVGRLLTLKGTVIRSGAVKVLEGEQDYECTKCKFR